MKSMSIIATLLWTMCLVNANAAEQLEVSFFKGTVEAARQKAKAESKLYFIEFHAKWCEPCKWMDEYTFKNTELANFIDKAYVPIKVDVENMDGFVWKQKYKVQYLPTIIVLNGNGTMLGKYEKSLAAGDLLRILKNHRAAPLEVESSATVQNMNGDAPGKSLPVKTTEYEARPTFVSVSGEPGLPKASEVAAKKPVVNTNLKPMKTTTTKPQNTAYPIHIDPAKELQAPYRVQVGVFTDAANMMSEVNKFRKAYTQSVQVFNIKNKESNVVTYRITLGKFSTRDEALAFSQELKSKGVNGVIKHITEHDQTMQP